MAVELDGETFIGRRTCDYVVHAAVFSADQSAREVLLAAAFIAHGLAATGDDGLAGVNDHAG